MMRTITKTTIAISFLLLTGNLKAQLESIDFLYGVTSDAEVLLQEYIRPYANIMGANLNGGWYNTAEPHKLGGFDITINASVAFAPLSALTYDLNSLDLQAEVSGAGGIAPTVAGDQETRPELIYETTVYNPMTEEDQSFELARITHPNGANGINYLPVAMPQVTIGLVKGTDVSLRFFPETQIMDLGRIGLFGIGGRHSISQWIPILKQLKFINISVQGGYTKVSTMAQLNMQPIAEIENPDRPNYWDEQFVHMDISGWTVNLIASQSIPVITVYEGIGYSSSLVEMAVLGQYPINTLVLDEGPDFGKTTYDVVEDPIPEMKFENYKNLRLNAGIRFKLGPVTLHYDFTKTLYATHTAGIGITFR